VSEAATLDRSASNKLGLPHLTPAFINPALHINEVNAALHILMSRRACALHRSRCYGNRDATPMRPSLSNGASAPD